LVINPCSPSLSNIGVWTESTVLLKKAGMELAVTRSDMGRNSSDSIFRIIIIHRKIYPNKAEAVALMLRKLTLPGVR
jgi:hypothetical protein